MYLCLCVCVCACVCLARRLLSTQRAILVVVRKSALLELTSPTQVLVAVRRESHMKSDAVE
jgi:hypothetical protein